MENWFLLVNHDVIFLVMKPGLLQIESGSDYVIVLIIFCWNFVGYKVAAAMADGRFSR